MSTSHITLRSASATDGPAFAELRVEAMRESLEAVGRFDPQRARDRFLASFDPQHTREILLAGQRVGFVVVRPAEDGLLLDHLYVVPSAQGSGVGTGVLRMVFAEADRARKSLHVGALKGSRSNAFYLRHGFQLVKVADWDNYYVRLGPEARFNLSVPPP